MTHVYSGGLMYEYSMEPNNFGIVKINGGVDQTGEREELDEFEAFAAALKKWPAPTDDGGYTKTSSASECPTKDSHWDVESSVLPDTPPGALKVRHLLVLNTHALGGPLTSKLCSSSRRVLVRAPAWKAPVPSGLSIRLPRARAARAAAAPRTAIRTLRPAPPCAAPFPPWTRLPSSSPALWSCSLWLAPLLCKARGSRFGWLRRLGSLQLNTYTIKAENCSLTFSLPWAEWMH